MTASSEPRVIVYTTQICGYCRAAKQLLQARGIAYTEVDLTDDHAQRSALVEKTGWRTVPLIEIDGELIGGFNELRSLDKQGGLPSPE